jgi:hypothetical protein
MGVQCTFDLCVVAVLSSSPAATVILVMLLTLFTMREGFNRTRDGGLVHFGRYSVCHGTGAVILVPNSGPTILVQKF